MLPKLRPTFLKTADASLQYTYTTIIGNRCYVRLRSADGTPHFLEWDYTPTYYLPSDTYTGISSYDGMPLVAHACASIRDGREFLKQHPDTYGNIQCEYMALADIYGSTDVACDMDRLLVWNLDIETPGETFAPIDNPFNPISAITVIKRHLGQREVVVYGLGDYTADGVTYHRFESEDALLTRFLRDWKNGGNYPDIVTGWNIQFYDLPYLVNRMQQLWGDTRDIRELSPFRDISTRQVLLYGREQTVVDIRGLAILDYLELYRKFTFAQRESYRLDHIAHVELNKRKLSFKEYHSLHGLYRDNYQTFIDYNIRDVELVDALDEKLKLIDLVCALAYGAKANYVDTFKQVRLWDVMIYHYLRAQQKQLPPKRDVDKTEQYAGAFVKEPLVGQHAWVVSFDVASMYPSIIREWNISPEKMAGAKLDSFSLDALLAGTIDLAAHYAEQDVAIAANGLRTLRDREGFLPVMLKTLYDERVRFKALASDAKKRREKLSPDDPQYAVLTKQIAAYHNQQMVRKVNLNSAYGALGSNYFRFYDTDMAEAVTVTGQYVIRHVAQRVNAFLNKTFKTDEDYIIASDTDSIYVCLDRVAQRYNHADVQKTVTFLDRFCEEVLQRIIDTAFANVATYMNVLEPCLTMKREVIADKGIWTAKKRYILNVWDTEGVRYQAPKLKMMGIEAVKSSTPELVREMITDALSLLMRGTQEELWAFIDAQYARFSAAPFEDVAFPRSVNGVSKYADALKGIPLHVRGALVYNRRIAGMPAYQTITEGQKIKYAYLREPNPFQSNVLAAPDGCPAEWEIERWIDYRTQWQKAFLEPLQAIVQCVGWNVEAQMSLF